MSGTHVELDTFTDQQYAAFVRLADVVGPDAMVEAFFETVPHVVPMAARYAEEEHGE